MTEENYLSDLLKKEEETDEWVELGDVSDQESNSSTITSQNTDNLLFERVVVTCDTDGVENPP